MCACTWELLSLSFSSAQNFCPREPVWILFSNPYFDTTCHDTWLPCQAMAPAPCTSLVHSPISPQSGMTGAEQGGLAAAAPLGTLPPPDPWQVSSAPAAITARCHLHKRGGPAPHGHCERLLLVWGTEALSPPQL